MAPRWPHSQGNIELLSVVVSGGVHLKSKVAKLVVIVVDKSRRHGSAYRKDPARQFLIVMPVF